MPPICAKCVLKPFQNFAIARVAPQRKHLEIRWRPCMEQACRLQLLQQWWFSATGLALRLQACLSLTTMPEMLPLLLSSKLLVFPALWGFLRAREFTSWGMRTILMELSSVLISVSYQSGAVCRQEQSKYVNFYGQLTCYNNCEWQTARGVAAATIMPFHYLAVALAYIDNVVKRDAGAILLCCS